MMRAVVLPAFGPPEVLREQLVPTPVAARGEVLVQVAAALGSLTVSLALHLGGHVIAASRKGAKRDRLKALGAGHDVPAPGRRGRPSLP